jgi:predicted HTH transcriptional regulator
MVDVDLLDIEQLIAGGESETLELKQSTGQLRRAAETLRGFLNAIGGTVVFGVSPAGRMAGSMLRTPRSRRSRLSCGDSSRRPPLQCIACR